MSGLEAVEIKLSDLLEENDEFRIDSEFFRKEYMFIENISNFKSLSKIVTMADVSSNGSFAKVKAILHDGNPETVPYIRSGNVGCTFINEGELNKISKEAHRKLSLSATKLHDVVMARKGKIGGASIVTEKEVNFNCNENVIKLTLTDSEINPFYFVAFLNSKYGVKQVERMSTGNVQPWLSIYQIRKMKLVMAGMPFQNEVERVIRQAHSVLAESKELYANAEKMLIDELGMSDFSPSQEPVAIKTLAESLGTSGRLDAEYYQPKYNEILQKLDGVCTSLLSDIVHIKKSIEPGSGEYTNEGIPFVRVSDMTKFGLTAPEIHISKVPFAYMDLQPKKDSILLSKDGTVGIAYKAEEKLDIITSGAILHLSVKNKSRVLPDYLTMVLNSVIVQMQAERDAGGSIIQHWKPSEIEKVIIPVLDITTQQKISDKIQQSFALRRQSENLLEAAKRAVEIAIEQGEEAAANFTI